MEYEPKAISLWNPPENLGYPRPNQAVAPFIVESYGNTEEEDGDEARILYNAALYTSRMEVDIPAFVRAVLDLPPGYRTRVPFNGNLPLGLLVYMIAQGAIARDGNDSVMGSLVLVGGVTRYKNRVVLGAPVPNTYVNQEDTLYYPKRIGKDVDSFYFQAIPLDRIHYDYPFDTPPNRIFSTRGGTSLRMYDWDGQGLLCDLITYMNSCTAVPGEGSDLSFFLTTSSTYIYRRYQNLRVASEQTQDKFRCRVIRSAGLRQILFRRHIEVFMSVDALRSPLRGESLAPSEFTLFIPSGQDGNCFEAAVSWGFMQHSISVFNPRDSSVDMKSIWYRIVTERCEDLKLSDVKYRRRYMNGYPTVEMRKIAFLFYMVTRKKCKIQLFYNKSKGSESRGVWTDILKDSETADAEYSITLFQCRDTGYVRDDSCSNQLGEADKKSFLEQSNDGTLGHMMHCVGIHPTPACFDSSTVTYPKINTTRKNLIHKVNAISSSFFDSMQSKRQYWDEINEDDIDELVVAQKSRYKDSSTHTLIFRETKKTRTKLDEDSNRTPVWLEKKFSQNADRPIVYVGAYDLETIGNLSRYQHMVYTPFQKDALPPDLEAMGVYEPMESQIPFSAQWLLVNVSDSEEHLRRKRYELDSGSKMPDTTTFFTPDRDSEDPDVFLTKPFTEYDSADSLGKCVETMLLKIARAIHARGGETVYMYAHNGCHFDSYVVLQFQRFEITSILKTSRGVMTVNLRVPVIPTDELPFDYNYRTHFVDNDEVPKITITLRDTMLHVPGSLARLCKGFNVPAKYCKLDFPIVRVDATNFHHPRIMPLVKEYGENDVRALGYIIQKINLLIGNSPWKPASIGSLKPPISQFVTCMSMIRASTRLHFTKIMPENLHPNAIDIPALRVWLQNATVGGRVNAYAKTYMSPFAGDILRAFLDKDEERLKRIHSVMLEKKKCMQTLDFTSLYPYAMNDCPMPTGPLKSLTAEQCEQDIQAIACDTCERTHSLCARHRGNFNDPSQCNLRPFSIVLVKNVYVDDEARTRSFRNMCPRKSFKRTTQKANGLEYSLEDGEEFEERMKAFSKTQFHEIQSFTNVDLYWMRKQGFEFDIIGGFGFHVSSIYNTFIGPAFKHRIQAKKDGNKLLSDFLKLNYNGSFGITTQQDITDSYFPMRYEPEMKYSNPLDPEMRKYIYNSTHHSDDAMGVLASEELTGEAFYLPNGQMLLQKRKKEHLGEYFADQSPMQIGAAVLSWSRHIANLVMFGYPEEIQTYTDTDSICIAESAIQDTCLNEMVQNRDDAPLGSLKNDHAENNGVAPRIFLSFIGGKKVKLHVTLNEKGEVRVYVTFKGLSVSSEKDGKILTDDYVEKVCAQTLYSLNMTSSADPVIVQSWKRDLQAGVSIGNHIQTLSRETYLGDTKGTYVTIQDCGVIEHFIPHGCKAKCHFPVNRDLSSGGVPTQDPLRIDRLIEDIYSHGGIHDFDLFSEFLDAYYKNADKEYSPGTKEYEYIMNVFNEIANEIL